MEQMVISAQQARKMRRNNIVKGTLILTFAGFVTRFIGFFYRIFLSNTMDAELLGIYQLIFPVYGICYTVYAMGIQTSISSLVAAEIGKRNPKNVTKILRVGLILSVSLAAFLSLLVYINADFIAYRFLLEIRSADSLRILSIVFPFCGITACINGYYYGLKSAGVPAFTQLLEQVVRVFAVYVMALYAGNGDMRVTCEYAVIGLVIGEVVSCAYNIFSMFLTKSPSELIPLGPDANAKPNRRRTIIRNMLSQSVPLSANRLLLSILHSIEAIMIPTMLRRYGLSPQESLVIFGVLNGMSIPFIMFPTAITNALSVLLLPTISEAQAINNDKLIGRTTAISIKYSLIIGIISTGLFIVFGQDLGYTVFNNKSAGAYLVILAWLCPFLYLATTLTSIINGLGKAHVPFINSVVATLCKIGLIVFLIPSHGITGYLIALLIGQLIVTGLDMVAVVRLVHFDLDSINSLIKPAIIVAASSFMVKSCYDYIQKMTHISGVIYLLTFCMLLCVISVILLLITGAISKKDIR